MKKPKPKPDIKELRKRVREAVSVHIERISAERDAIRNLLDDWQDMDDLIGEALESFHSGVDRLSEQL